MIIGKNNETNKFVDLDLNRLIATRLLVQASSGAGKSWLLRRLLEQSHGKIQQIVIDLEGEFSTLREEFDYLLVGNEGEIPTSIKTADLLARKLLELNVSTIIDLSELKKHERILFVKRFIDSLLSAPKRLWHPLLLFIDEAHQFAPQSSKCESTSSVIDAATRGRKRGIAVALATQRISKLHKDACAECFNKLIGRTGLDVDMKRAGDELGLSSKADIINLRKLEDGEFFSFGPAISNEVQRVKVGQVKTTHVDRAKGVNIKETSETPENIKKILGELIDLPKEVDEELKTKNEMLIKIKSLEKELRIEKRKGLNTNLGKESLESQRKSQKAFENAVMLSSKQSLAAIEKKYKEVIGVFERRTLELTSFVEKFKQSAIKLLEGSVNSELVKEDVNSFVRKNTIRPASSGHVRYETEPKVENIVRRESFEENDSEYKLNLCERKFYSLLYQYPDKRFTRQQVGVFTGYSWKSGSTANALSRLNSLGLINRENALVSVAKIVPELAQDFDFSRDALISKLNKCEREIYEVLSESPAMEFNREDLAMQTPSQYSHNSGSFSNALSKLNTLGLLVRNNGLFKLNPSITELE